MKQLLRAVITVGLVLLLHGANSQARSLVNGKDIRSPTPAQPCDSSKCKLPNCRCAGEDIPGGLAPKDTPQIVMFSFDDGLRTMDYDNYYSKLFNARKNPNGCHIGLTFYVSHNYTDYALVEDVYYTNGYEIADHSVDHREPTTWWKNATIDEWTHEIMDQASILAKWGNIPSDTIRGFRAPFLETSENEIKVLHDNKFLYEASMGTATNYWPYTLDYKSPICLSPATCPVNSYPGLWLIPILYYKQNSGFPCSMLDACTAPTSEEEWFNFFMENFNAHKTNRSPFGIYSHSAWFYYGEQRMNAMISFLDKLAEMKDVYIVTPTQMLEWVQNPTPLSKIGDFEPWKCPTRPKPRCVYKQPTCNKTYGPDQSLRSCTAPCPPNYPHYGDPDGK